MKKDFTHVYIAKIPEKIGDTSNIFPIERREYIENTKNADVRQARYYVWRLLDVAIKKCLGKDIKNLSFAVDGGRWSTPTCHISLSHGGGYAAVALSSGPVGVDIEPLTRPHAKNFAERILTSSELKRYEKTAEREKESELIRLWSKKEAIFKSLGKSAFMPQKIDTVAYLCEDRLLNTPDCELVLAIAHGENIPPQIFENTEI